MLQCAQNRKGVFLVPPEVTTIYPITVTIPHTSNTKFSVSVLVPVYNTGPSLRRCLESLAAQTCPDIEFICINDGSTDNSPQELDAWAAKDSRFRVIHQINGGYGKAMNAGLREAKGDYIGIVEPDDWVEPDMFEHLYTLAQDKKADISKANYYIEKKRTSRHSAKFERLPEGCCTHPLDLPEYLSGSPCIWSALYRRDMLSENNIVFSETPGASFQDLGFCIRTWLVAKSIAITHYAAYHYWEDNPISSSRRMEDGAWAAFKEIELLSETFSPIKPEETKKRSLIVLRIFATLKADYKLRIRNTGKSFLLKYSHLLHEYFPLNTLDTSVFKKDEWHDIQLIYHNPLLFPKKGKTKATMLQRLCSYRTEANQHVFRLMGLTFFVPMRDFKTHHHPQVVQMSDGLGNQLFQYTFALALKS